MRNDVTSQFLLSSSSNGKCFDPVYVCFKILSTEEDLLVLAMIHSYVKEFGNSFLLSNKF